MRQESAMRGFTHWPVLLVLVVCVLFLYQNCADPMQLASEDQASFNDTLPFAYDATIDTLSYMSCSEMDSDYNPRTYFTFRVGAYGANAGLGLSPEFLNQTANFKPEQRAIALRDAKSNTGSQVQLAIRRKGDYQSVLSQNQNSYREGMDYHNLLASLDTPVISTRVGSLESGQRINYFSGIPGLEGRLFEGSLRFVEAEQTAESVRSNLLNQGLITLTYTTGDAEPVLARTPSADGRDSVYGLGFEVDFKLSFGIDPANPANRPRFVSGVRRTINSVREVNLVTGYTSGDGLRPWVCRPDDNYVIVRAEDLAAGRTACTTGPDPLNLSPEDAAKLERVRRVLRVEDWWVDLARNCIVAKQPGPSCYGPDDNAQLNVSYNGSACGTNGVACPHYVSVCTRQ